jgi:hypothetical protein
MDLANYIGELLELYGEICVPGLGCFVKTHTNAYYNEQDHTFYPPSKRVIFDPQTIEDDTLVNYIASKKKISNTSATYFVEKYISNLKEQISLYEVAFTDIGWLYSENLKLVFKAKDHLEPADPDFFGYAPLKVYKVGSAPAFPADAGFALKEPSNAPVTGAENAPPEINVTEKADPSPATIREMLLRNQTVTEVAAPKEEVGNTAMANPEPAEAEVEQTKRSFSIWLIVATVIVVLAGALGALYLYKPVLFGQLLPVRNPKAAAPVVMPVKKVDTIKKHADTAIKPMPIADSSKTVAPPATDLTKVKHYEILAGSFKLLTKANSEKKKFEDLGFKPHILDHVQSTRYQISLGTYLTREEAIKEENNLVNSGKVQKEKLFIQPINPK